MAYIGNIPAEKFTSVDIQNFTVSATANYTLDRPVANENEIELFINNVRQHPGSGKAYTASGTALTLSEATAGTDTMYCVYQGKARQTVTPATSSVTNDMLAGSIADAKISAMAASKLTGTVAQANIADQAINEAKMQISNAPTNGYFLSAQSGNTGGLTWAEAGGGDLVLVASAEGTNSVGDVSINDCFSATYANYLITFAINNDRSGNYNNFRFQADDDSTFDNNYNYCLWGYDEGGTLRTSFSNSGSACPLNSLETPDDDSWVFGSCTGYMYVYHPYTLTTGGLRRLRAIGQVFNVSTTGTISGQSLQMQLKQNSYNVAGIRFRPSANYITERRVRVYGIKDS